MIAGLPYDAEVEYLESTGTQWIDTGILPTSQSKVEVDAIWTLSIPAGNPTNPTLFGSRIAYPLTMFEVLQSGTGQLYYQYGPQSPSKYVPWKNERIVYCVDANNIYLNGVFLTSANPATFSIPYNIALFALNKAGVVERHSIARVYTFRAWDGSGVLVADMIPVRFTNEQNQSEGAMYDRVSRKLFRNAGTGAFVVGPDVASPVMGLHFFQSPAIAS